MKNLDFKPWPRIYAYIEKHPLPLAFGPRLEAF